MRVVGVKVRVWEWCGYKSMRGRGVDMKVRVRLYSEQHSILKG